jgi:small subunit ribosomal protein S17
MVNDINNVRTITGVVTKDSRDKTIQVQVETTKRHDLYQKVIRRSTCFQVHDENNLAKIGNVVRIRQSRPYSKTKSWELVDIVG